MPAMCWRVPACAGMYRFAPFPYTVSGACSHAVIHVFTGLRLEWTESGWEARLQTGFFPLRAQLLTKRAISSCGVRRKYMITLCERDKSAGHPHPPGLWIAVRLYVVFPDI